MSSIKQQNIEELNAVLVETRERLRAFRFDSAGSRARNVRTGRVLRKEIARLLTEIQSRKIASLNK